MKDKNSFAPNPPMGWNSWDCYDAAVTEEQLKKNADYMAANLKKFGYEYIVCDAEWYKADCSSLKAKRFSDIHLDEYGRTIPDVDRFPSSAGGKGFGPIADYCHERGLKFGIHIMRGLPRQAVFEHCKVKGTDLTVRDIAHPSSICVWNTDMYGVDTSKPGAQEYYDSLFELYASWGLDFIKVDDVCVIYGALNDESNIRYGGDEIELIRRAIDKCGRDIVLSLSPGPAMLSQAEHLRANGNMWRITNDFWDDWRAVANMFDRCKEWAPYVSEGSFPDCDMLPFGHLTLVGSEGGLGDRYTRLSFEEQRTIMTLWSLFRSPLILGCELNDLDPATLSLITNEEVLSLEKRSRNARQAYRSGNYVLWFAEDKDNPLVGDPAENMYYAALFNLDSFDTTYAFRLADVGLGAGADAGVSYMSGNVDTPAKLSPTVFCGYQVHDMWSGEDLGLITESMAVDVPCHGARLFRLTLAR